MPNRAATAARADRRTVGENMSRVSIEGLSGIGFPNPCLRCGKHSTQPGTPDFDQRVVGYRCPFCDYWWTRPIEDDSTRTT
jgi:hypothetical protein